MHALADLKLPKSQVNLQREVLDQVRERTLETCQRLGVIRDDRMTEAKYRAGRFELLAALAYPDADVEGLTLCNDFNVCLFYIDDQADEDERYGKRPTSLAEYFDKHVQALRGVSVTDDDCPAAALLNDIRLRLASSMSEQWLTRFVADFSEYLHRGALTAACHWAAGTIPTAKDYAEHRASDSAVVCIQNLIERVGSGELNGQVVRLSSMQRLRRICAEVVAYTNDLVSYAKELRHNPSPNNLVHILRIHECLSLDDASEHVIDLVNEKVASFDDIVGGLPDLGSFQNAQIERYVRGQRAWMSGNLLWSLASGRYADAASPLAELRELLRPTSVSELPLLDVAVNA
jgi:hypothetical protein